MSFIFPLSFVLFAVFFLILSTSKKNYQKLVENNGEKFAKNVNKGLKVCGCLLLICSLLWFAFIFF